MRFLILIIVLTIFLFLLEKILNKLLGVEKKKISESSGKKVDKWGRVIILVIFLCTFPFFVVQETNVMIWYWMIYLTALLGFQSILEWKYLKNSKQYVTTLIFLILGVIFLYNIKYILQLLG
ncbi:DUF4181 domain-containing protein [Solibacillus sp. MA9]|uniref:DUF4181 domain-containing protein n=1 Tax=Solibacillus palustris TaxID=2908203 RepID=A0ABS9UI55_9BACL|nr:DUF4181 domain-containing protein [Solibacillus sp. MA9]